MFKTIRRDLKRLHGTVSRLGGEVADADCFPFLGTVAAQVVGCESCVFHICDPITGELTRKSISGTQVEPPADSLAVQVISTRRAILRDRILCQPILSHDGEQVIGALELAGKQDGTFSPADMAFAETLARHVAVTVEQSFLAQETFAAIERFQDKTRRLLTITLGLGATIVAIVLVQSAAALTTSELLSDMAKFWSEL